MKRVDSKAVANYFLDLAAERGEKLTQMKLQRLVYLAHGWQLGLTGSPLLNEAIQAWSYGPVVRSLYKAFEDAGDGPIIEKAAEFVPERIPEIRIPDLNESADPEAGSVRRLLTRIWNVYGELSGIQLSKLSREAGTPWDRVHNKHSGSIPKYETIPDEWIKEYFENQASRRTA